jgi:hypothetical protein
VLYLVRTANQTRDTDAGKGIAETVERQEEKWMELYADLQADQTKEWSMDEDIPYPMLHAPKSISDIQKKPILDYIVYATSYREQYKFESKELYEKAAIRAVKKRAEEELDLWKGENVVPIVNRFSNFGMGLVWLRFEAVERCLVDIVKDLQWILEVF